MSEAYILVKGHYWKYLYRTVDKTAAKCGKYGKCERIWFT